MHDLKDNDEVYEVEFEELQEGELKPLDTMKAIINTKLDIDVSIGSSYEKLDKILGLKIGDVIVLDKYVEEDLDININKQKVANGESIILDSKLAVRVSKINIEDN